MLFHSYAFLLGFLPVVLTAFFCLGRYASRRAAVGWLVLASLFSYGWWRPAHVLLLLFSIGFNFLIGRGISDPGRHSFPVRRAGLVLGIAVNLALLGGFKYTTFAARQLTTWFDLGWDVPVIILPLAISFFTFQQIAYLCDAYQGYCREYRFVDYALFVSFFPQLIAGPIVHHQEMMPQFRRCACRYDSSALAWGLSYFVIGMFKKMVLADTFARFATPVFTAAARSGEPTMGEAWGGVLAYTFQIYFDFSGYSDMAIGLAGMIGIRLPVNFNSPYQSRDIAEFWRRWHITLSRFLRDYLYVPLGGNRRSPLRHRLNLFVTMVLGGIWHGAGWTFLAWGALHGLFLVLHRQWRRLPSLPGPAGPWRASAATMLTFLCVTVGWVLFRSDTLDCAGRILAGMTGAYGLSLSDNLASALGFLASWGVRFDGTGSFDTDGLTWIAAGFVIVWALPSSQQWMGHPHAASPEGWARRVPRWTPRPAWAAVLAAMCLTCWLRMQEVHEFLYFQF